MSAIGGVVTFFHDVFSDLKSSRRFQVSMLLWIPLIITIGVFVVLLGEWHTESHKFPTMKSSFVRRTFLDFPEIMLWTANPTPNPWTSIQAPKCYQRFDNSTVISGSVSQCPHNKTDPNCFILPLSTRTSRGLDSWDQGIDCLFTFPAAPGANNIVAFTTRGGWSQSSGWNNDWVGIRPNMRVSVILEPSMVRIGNHDPVFSWNNLRQYESTVFTSGAATGSYNMTMSFRMPFTNFGIFDEQTGLDSWMVCALWGGGIFFFYLLHLAVFSLLALFLPDDSKIYGRADSSAGREFQNIR